MNSGLVFALLSLVAFVSADQEIECSEEAIEQCVGDLTEVEFDPDNREEFCVAARNTINCFDDKAEKCLQDDDADDNEAKEELSSLVSIVTAVCGKGDDEPTCLQSTESLAAEAEKCGKSAAEPLKNEIKKYSSVTNDDKICMAYSLVIECLVDSLVETCGSTVANLIREGAQEVMQGEITYSEDSERCKEIFESRRKKRSIRMRLPSLLSQLHF